MTDEETSQQLKKQLCPDGQVALALLLPGVEMWFQAADVQRFEC